MKKYFEKIAIMAAKRNLLPKLISIFLAVILWAYLTSTKSGEVRFKLPVTYKNLDQTLTVSRLTNKYIMVKVKGRKEDLKNVNSRNVKLYIDLSRPQVGEFKSYPVQIAKNEFPEELDIDLSPEDVKLLVEKKASRIVRIMPRHSGNPVSGFILGQIKVNPEYVKISGSGTVLNNINEVYTEDIYIDNKNTTFKTDVKIEKINEDEIEYSLSDVSVTVPVVVASGTVPLELPVVIKNRKKGYGYELKSDKVKISVFSGRKYSDLLNVVAFIDAAEISLSGEDFSLKNRIEKEVPVHINIGESDENSLLSVTPEKIKVVITRE